MYRREYTGQLEFENFYLPFGGKLRSDNRWVILSKQVPWDIIEQRYALNFKGSKTGKPAKSARVALGALIIKERLTTSDVETVEQIRENPYLQYFLGFKGYRDEKPFDSSSMTHFRKRFDAQTLADINELIIANAIKSVDKKNRSSDDNDHSVAETKNEKSDKSEDSNKPSHKGKLLADATCTPADIAYPTDLNLLNEAREKSEEIIDSMHFSLIGKKDKPRTYRQKARKDYLAVAKKRSSGKKNIRKAIGKQLGYLKRNLRNIEQMACEGLLVHLSKREYRNLLVISELYRQQQWMYDNHKQRIDDRIVSISQPHIRPIIRGKARSKVEFGAKISVSLVDGFSYVDKIGWDNYNESQDLIGQIEEYRRRFGYYPESVHADQIYRNRKNRQYCKDHGIRLSGPPLGRPRKLTAENAEELELKKRQAYQDEIDRIAIEGKFGQAKRRFSLGCIMAKLASTAQTVIMIGFIVMNLEKILSSGLSFLLHLLLRLLSAAQSQMQRESRSNYRLYSEKLSQSLVA